MRDRQGRFAGLLLVVLLVISPCLLAGQQRQQIAPARKSDSSAVDESGRKIRVQHGELPKENFQIAGVDLASNEEALKQAARILGPVKVRATGDAADADERACYCSADKSDKTRLYFHRGEVSPWFVLSSTTPVSERKDICRPSSNVTRNISTASGLHLGLTEGQMIAILGLPTSRSHKAGTGRDFMDYEFETKKRDSPQELARAHQEHPGMSERELEDDDYGYYDLGEAIKAEFLNNALIELAVYWTGTT